MDPCNGLINLGGGTLEAAVPVTSRRPAAQLHCSRKQRICASGREAGGIAASNVEEGEGRPDACSALVNGRTR